MDNKELTKQEFETLSEFRYRLRGFLSFSEKVTHDYGITPLQYQLLLHIKGFPERDWARIGELAERLQAKHHGAVALVSRCEKLGLVERRRNRPDKREVDVHLTAKGEQLVTQIAKLHRDEHHSLVGSSLLPQLQELSEI